MTHSENIQQSENTQKPDNTQQPDNIRKNFVWNTVGSLTLSFTSLIFMIVATRVNGPELAGIFTFAFSFACVIQVVANYSGRSYQVTNNDKSINYSNFIYARFITNIIMIICSVAYIIWNGYTDIKVLVIIANVALRVMESIQDVFYGVLQKEDQLYKVGISMFAKALISISAFFAIDLATNNIVLASFSMCVSYLLVFLIYDIRALHLLSFKFKPIERGAIAKILKGGFWVFLFTLLTQYVMNAQKFAIDGVLPDQMQAIFGILIMPATLMVLCSQLIVQPFMTRFSDYVKGSNYKGLTFSLTKIVVAVLVLGVIVVIAAYFVGIPVLEIIYGLPLQDYQTGLCIILVGSVLFGISYAISSCLIAMRKNIFQVVIYGVASILTFFISNNLVNISQVDGAVYAYLFTMIIIVVLYLGYFIFCMAQTKLSCNSAATSKEQSND